MLLLLAGLNGIAYAAVTVDFVAMPAQISTREKESIVYLRSKGGSLTNLKCWISALVPERGDPGPLDALQCSAPDHVDADKIEKITLTVSSGERLKRGSYTGTLQVLGLDQSGTSATQKADFKLVVPAVTMKLAETDALRIQLIRMWPFSAAREAVSIAFRVTSDLQPATVPTILRSELYVPDGAFKDIVPGGYLKGQFCSAPVLDSGPSPKEKKPEGHFWSPPPETIACINGGEPLPPGQTHGLADLTLQIEPSVPSNLKEASGTLHIRSRELAADMDVPVALLVKDWWVYAAIVVLLGQLLSFSVSNWINTGRQGKLNKLAMGPVESGLVGFLLARPDLVNSSDVAAINTLLDTAVQANKLGEVDAAKSSIKAAQAKLDELKASPTPEPQQPSAPLRLLLLQSGHAYVDRRLNFMILNPDPAWKDAAMYKWEWTGQKTSSPQLLFEAQGLKDISTEFYAPGLYNLHLSVEGKPVCSLPFRVEQDKSRWSLSRIAKSDKAILLLAVVFAAILSYLTIEKLETFGTVSDYALAFLGGFGLNATTSGFSAVLSGFRSNPQGTAPVRP